MMSREQFIEADRRVRRYLILILLLTACAAMGLALLLPAWAATRELFRAAGGEGAARLLFGLLLEAVFVGPLLLIPYLSVVWVNRRLGLRCPGCRQLLTLNGRYRELLRTGRCFRCRQTLFAASEGQMAAPDAATRR